MVWIEHVAAALDRMDNWTDYDEAQIRRLLGVDQKKVVLYLNRRQMR